MVAINNDLADIPSVNFSVQGSDISAPAAARGQLYVKSNGLWYILNGGTATRLTDNPLTTAGDIIISGASGLPTRLAKGNDSDVLTIDPATHLPVWAAPGAQGITAVGAARRAAAQTITTATLTPIQFDTEDADLGDMVDLGANNTRITAPVAGLYQFSAYLEFSNASSSGTRGLYVKLNGTTYPVTQRSDGTQGLIFGQTAALHLVLAATDYVELVAYHTRGSNLDVVAARASLFLVLAS